MTYIYIDESGDLGMDCKMGQYFIITAIKINNEKDNLNFNRIPLKIRKILYKKRDKKKSEIKFFNSSDSIRVKIIKKSATLNIEIFSVIINKNFVYDRLKNNLPILYNYLIKILLEKVLTNLNKNDNLVIFLDRCMSFSQRENFENYIKTEFLYLFQKIPKVEIFHDSSQNNGGLQVTDFICGAFGYKYNTLSLKEGSDIYTRIIKDKIVAEKTDLFKKNNISQEYENE